MRPIAPETSLLILYWYCPKCDEWTDKIDSKKACKCGTGLVYKPQVMYCDNPAVAERAQAFIGGER